MIVLAHRIGHRLPGTGRQQRRGCKPVQQLRQLIASMQMQRLYEYDSKAEKSSTKMASAAVRAQALRVMTLAGSDKLGMSSARGPPEGGQPQGAGCARELLAEP